MVFYILLKVIYNHNNHTQCSSVLLIYQEQDYSNGKTSIITLSTTRLISKCERDDELGKKI